MPSLAKRSWRLSVNARDVVGIDGNEADFRALFTVGGVIGVGSYATVKKAIRRSDGEDVAVRIIDKYDENGAELAIWEEMTVLRRIKHPRIVQTFAIYESDRQWIHVMQLGRGGDLFERIRRQGHFTEAGAAMIVRQLLEGVAYLHSQGIVHRDIKPENIILTTEDEGNTQVVIIDYGLATIVNNDRALTRACGSAAYAAPEALKEYGYGRPVDIWALGVVTYILLVSLFKIWVRLILK
ncbi:hypothetical protein HDU97_006373 [Phlyctochytrium planicorne]|nr:hypothetical protein HDU97_006373 [Phlyctochytrium planicorne]